MKIGFVGFGHMAQTIFVALDGAKVVSKGDVCFSRRDAKEKARCGQQFGITASTLPHLVAQSELIFLCVKPQQVEEAIAQLNAAGSLEGKWVISVLAGIRHEFLQKKLGRGVEVLRAMPNIASAVNQGMTILTGDCCAALKKKAELLFGAMGEVISLPEALMDIATGMAGSGPGFVFRLIDAMAGAGVKEGMAYSDALKIAAQTFAGASQLILHGHLPRDLLVQIATPNGTTQAGLEAMDQSGVDKHFQQAIETAAQRSKKLG